MSTINRQSKKSASAQSQADIEMSPYKGLKSKYININDLNWLRDLFFASRRIVEGQYAGRHSSNARGHSVEFNDFRQYMPGDEPTDIDWKLYGRTDRLFVKLFEHQSDMAVNILVDASASMNYAGIDESYSKYDHACMMAAAISFLTTKQQDKISFALAQNGVKNFSRPFGSFKHFCEILQTMEDAQPAGVANLPDAIRKLASLIGRKGLLIVFTDLLDDMEETLDALNVFTHRGSEVIIFHVLHKEELALPDLDDAVFIDSENSKKVSMNVRDIRNAYDKKLTEFLAKCSAQCKGRGIDYRLASTGRKYSDALKEFMFQRASSM